jgi:hypothetical protein
MSLPECDKYRVLTLNYAPPTIEPDNGYIVQWRPVGGTVWNTVEGVFNNPILIPNVPACYNIEGTIQANCGDGNLGKASYFAVSGAVKTCFLYSLGTNGTTYTYTSCSTNQATTVAVGTTAVTVSAYEGSISPMTGVSRLDVIA